MDDEFRPGPPRWDRPATVAVLTIAILPALYLCVGALVFGGWEVGWYFHQNGISAPWLIEAFRISFTIIPVAVLAVGIVLAVRAWTRGRRAFWYALGGLAAWVLVAGVFMTVSTMARINS